jgi:outer membrane protein, heavy metal efflux system
MKRSRINLLIVYAAASSFALMACVGTPVRGEREAQKRVDDTGDALHGNLSLPRGEDAGSEAAYMRYALRKHPSVEAAYQDWRSSVADVTNVRSLPDPRLTLQLDYADSLMSLMPGAMFDYTTRGKRGAAGNAAMMTSDSAYRDFAAKVLAVAANLHRAWLELAYADEALRLRSEAVAAYEEAAAASGNDYATATGGNLSAIANLGNEAARQRSLFTTLQERQVAARAAFKAALGLERNDPDPLWPSATIKANVLPTDDVLWNRVKTSNPELLKMRAMVNEAVANTSVAKTARTPDFSFGGMADVKANPLMYRPQASITLPIWKDKIRAGIDATGARKNAAEARVKEAEIDLAARFAGSLYAVRSADRAIAYIDASALPSLRAAAEISNSNFQSGSGMASAPLEARAAIVMAELDRLDALLEREMAATDLLELSANVAPETAPLIGR